MKIVIVGGVASGMSAATRLRRLQEGSEITVYERGEHVSYANCGLPYFVGGVIKQREDLLLQTPEKLWDRFRINVQVNTNVVAIEPSTRTLTVRDETTGTVRTDDYDYLVLATGASPRRLDVPGAHRTLPLRNVTDTDHVRAEISRLNASSVAVLGGGFVGVELAENLRHLGLDVHIIQRGSSILSQFDPEMIEPLQRALTDNGVHIHMHSQVAEIRERDVVLADGTALPADVVLCATGVSPDNQLAIGAGLRIGTTGGLWVDDQQRTSDPHIFAAGDAVEKHGMLAGNQALVPLANLANRHGRLIADVISGVETRAHASLGTIIIGAFGMSAAVTGLSERAAVAAGIAHQCVHLHPGSHAGYYPGATRVDLKVVFDPATGKILGAQAAGENGADKRIDVLATAIYAGLTIEDLMDLELAYAPQFGSAKDPINMAGYVGNNVLSHTTPTIQWHELDGALASGATLVDVRTPAEFSAGAIPGAMNIPVDDLRNRIGELAGQDIIVSCQVGQRGHIATQILKSQGVRVRNLDGGYQTWKDATSALARTQ